MFGDRWEYEFTLRALTPCHIGSGDVEYLTFGGRSDNKTTRVSVVQRDYQGHPYLAASSLKGALRALARGETGETSVSEALFGPAKASTDRSVASRSMGLLLLRGASLDARSTKPNASMPYVEALDWHHPERAQDAFIAARTKIDGRTGTADDHKLFFQEMMPAGATFTVRAVLLDHGASGRRARDFWHDVLARLYRDGLMLGKARADGQGQFEIVGAVKEIRRELSTSGVMVEASSQEIARNAKEIAPSDNDRWPFALTCKAPFLIVDSSREGKGKEAGVPQISAQRQSSDQPLLLGSSLAGVLKARAAWLAKLADLRGDWKSATDEAVGDAIVWLFGDTGQQGRLQIRRLSARAGSMERLTSLKIDRFSHAPVHGALFTTEAFVETELTFELHLVRRGKVRGHGRAEELLGLLVADLQDNGLKLGHGTNRGFGWFKPKGKKHGA
mgnify:CR=1 FL=1